MSELIEKYGIQGFIDELHEKPEDDSTLCACVDHLQTQDCTLTEVVRMYAGEPPDWHHPFLTQWALWRILSTWCRWSDPSVKSLVAGLPLYRHMAVEQWSPNQSCVSLIGKFFADRYLHFKGDTFAGKTVGDIVHSLYRINPNQMDSPNWLSYTKEHKRYVLRLFPDVEWTIRDYAILECDGDMKFQLQQTLKAPDWMPHPWDGLSFDIPPGQIMELPDSAGFVGG